MNKIEVQTNPGIRGEKFLDLLFESWEDMEFVLFLIESKNKYSNVFEIIRPREKDTELRWNGIV